MTPKILIELAAKIEDRPSILQKLGEALAALDNETADGVLTEEVSRREAIWLEQAAAELTLRNFNI